MKQGAKSQANQGTKIVGEGLQGDLTEKEKRQDKEKKKKN